MGTHRRFPFGVNVMLSLIAAATLAPLISLPGPRAAGDELVWFPGSFEEAVADATSHGKHTLVYFWANTENCARLYSETLQADPVREALGQAVCYSANAGEDAGRHLLDSYGLQTVPALLVLDPEGNELEMLTGFMNAGTFQAEWNRIRNDINTIGDLRRRAKGRHADREAEFLVLDMLAQKLAAVGEHEESERLLARMRRQDSKGNTSTMSQKLYTELYNEMVATGGEDPSTWDVSAIERFVTKLPKKNRLGRYQATISLGDLYQQVGRVQDALGTYARAWDARVDDVGSMALSYGLLSRLVNAGDQLAPEQRTLTLTIATELHDRIVASHAQRCSTCDGSRDDCPTYRADEQEVTDGFNTGHFVTDRPTQTKPTAQYWVAKGLWLNERGDEALALLRRALAVSPGNTFLADELVAMGGSVD